LMASYAGIAAVLAKKANPDTPLLITLADQRIGEGRAKKFHWIVRLILRGADQVIVSDPRQEQIATELTERARVTRAAGAGEALRNQIRFMYGAMFNERNNKIARPK